MSNLVNNKCPFCGHQVVKTSNKELYGKEYGNGICYLCTNCKASVGTHPNGEPLGVLANREMKILKKACHDLFDTAWKSRKISRAGAYKIMAEKLNIQISECHFGYFYPDMLVKALDVLKDPLWYKNDK